MASVQIKVTSSDRTPIVSVLEGGLDFDEVVVTHDEYAVKALIPLTILITVPTSFLLTKFVLEPLIGPVAKRWKKAVERYFNPPEIFTGCGLLLKRTRGLCVWLAVLIHASVLTLFIWQGRNSIVWAWNVALAIIVFILFRRSDASTWRTFTASDAPGAPGRIAQVLTVACTLLPALSFFGLWDMYLSGALYSGNTPVAVVRVDEQVYGRLPGAAKQQVFTTRGGERVLPQHEWAMAELNVPPYPEPRVYRQVALEVCKLEGVEARAELLTDALIA